MLAMLSVGADGCKALIRSVRTVESAVGDEDGDVTACISKLEESLPVFYGTPRCT